MLLVPLGLTLLLLAMAQGFMLHLAMAQGFMLPLAMAQGFMLPLAMARGFMLPLAMAQGFMLPLQGHFQPWMHRSVRLGQWWRRLQNLSTKQRLRQCFAMCYQRRKHPSTQELAPGGMTLDSPVRLWH